MGSIIVKNYVLCIKIIIAYLFVSNFSILEQNLTFRLKFDIDEPWLRVYENQNSASWNLLRSRIHNQVGGYLKAFWVKMLCFHFFSFGGCLHT